MYKIRSVYYCAANPSVCNVNDFVLRLRFVVIEDDGEGLPYISSASRFSKRLASPNDCCAEGSRRLAPKTKASSITMRGNKPV